MKEQLSEILKLDNFLKNFDIDIVEAVQGFLKLKFPLERNLLRPGGIMNGGAIMSIMDAAGGLAVMTYGEAIDELTVNMTVNFLRPVKEGPVTATSRVAKGGKKIYFVKMKLYDGKGNLCAYATGNWLIRRLENDD